MSHEQTLWSEVKDVVNPKMIDKPGNKVIDGYGREIQLKKAEIDHDKIDELWMSDPDFMADIEGSN